MTISDFLIQKKLLMFVNKMIAILRCFKVIFNGSLNLSFYNNLIKIKLSNFYNKNFYLQNNPDVKTSGMSAIRHFLLFGGFEGRNPSDKFNSKFYLDTYPDVLKSGMNPLVHYIKYGKKEGRIPYKTASFTEIEKQENEFENEDHTLNRGSIL